MLTGAEDEAPLKWVLAITKCDSEIPKESKIKIINRIN